MCKLLNRRPAGLAPTQWMIQLQTRLITHSYHCSCSIHVGFCGVCWHFSMMLLMQVSLVHCSKLISLNQTETDLEMNRPCNIVFYRPADYTSKLANNTKSASTLSVWLDWERQMTSRQQAHTHIHTIWDHLCVCMNDSAFIGNMSVREINGTWLLNDNTENMIYYYLTHTDGKTDTHTHTHTAHLFVEPLHFKTTVYWFS